jgi:hypothetical protein
MGFGSVPHVRRGARDYVAHRLRTPAAIVGRSGSIDWLCAPRFDSDAFLAALH